MKRAESTHISWPPLRLYSCIRGCTYNFYYITTAASLAYLHTYLKLVEYYQYSIICFFFSIFGIGNIMRELFAYYGSIIEVISVFLLSLWSYFCI